MQHHKRLDRHARPYTPGVDQPTVRLVIAEQQRADEVARPFRVGPSDDDELGAVEAFALDPRAAVARQVRAVDPLGDDALESMLTRGPAERLAVAALMLAVDDSRGGSYPSA